MLQILSNYGNINNIENKQQANTMKTIRITLKDAKTKVSMFSLQAEGLHGNDLSEVTECQKLLNR